MIRDKRLLMVRDYKRPLVFLNLGGTVEPGESDEVCVKREVLEEVGAPIKKGSLQFLYEFEDNAHGKPGKKVNIRLYLGELEGEPRPSSEIVELGWFDSSVDPKHLSPISINHIMPWLKTNGYIA